MNEDQIALQLYTVRAETARDMLGTLRQVAAQGYKAVEFAGYGGVPVADLRAHLDAQGLRAVAAHLGLDDLQKEPDRILNELRTLGCSYAVVAYIAEDRRGSADQVRQIAASFNRYGALCRDAGLRFAYHNHAFEFAPLGSSTVYDLLLDALDPALVAFELDVFWAQHANVDPVALITRLAGRVPLVHVKDMAADETRADRPVGDGMLPWPAIFAAGDAAGVEWYIVEQDHPQDPLPDVARSLANLRQMAAGG